MIAPEERIGNGRVQWVKVSEPWGINTICSRGGLFKGDLRVVTRGVYKHRVLVPFWANVLMHAAREQGIIEHFKPDLLIFQIFESIYHVRRYTYHLLEGQYGITFQHGEKGQLLKAKQALEELNIVAIGLRKGNAEQLAKVFRQRAGFIIKQIGKQPRDILKRKVLTYTVSLGSVLDSLGRVNEGVKRAITVAARDGVEERLIDIRCIEPKILSRRQTVESIIEEIELYLEGIFNFLSLLLRIDDPEKHISEDKLTRDTLIAQLGFYVQQIQHYDIAPFHRTVIHIIDEFKKARQFIKGTRYSDSVTLLRRSWNSLILRQVRSEVEKIILNITFMLFSKPARVSKIKCDKLIERIDLVIRQLSQVDEMGFQQPVVYDATSRLGQAIIELEKKQVLALREAKDQAKQAAQIL